jgi:hypothetical protein
MALDIEGYLISVNRFYRRWKYRKHFRLLWDFGRVVFQVDIKLQRSSAIFQNAPTDQHTPTAASIVFHFLRELIYHVYLLKFNYRLLLTSTILFLYIACKFSLKFISFNIVCVIN